MGWEQIMGAKKRSGTEKAAIILLALGEELASQIAAELDPRELRQIAIALSRITPVSTDEADSVLAEFHQQLIGRNMPIFSRRGAQQLLQVAIPHLDAATRANFDKHFMDPSSALSETLARFDAPALSACLKTELPQTIALVLAHCPAKQCAEVLKILPSTLRTELLVRIARLDVVDPEALHELDEVLRHKADMLVHSGQSKVGGIEAVASLLNTLDKNSEQIYLAALATHAPQLVEDVKKLMFKFSDLDRIDSQGIQELIKQVNPQTLKLALKSCPEHIQALIFRNMSQRAAALLVDDITSMAKVRLSDVEAAQEEIAQLARTLIDAGHLRLMDAQEAYV